MKILVIGGRGMAGHMIVDYLKQQQGIEVHCTTRTGEGGTLRLDARNLDEVTRVICDVHPDVVINAVGLLNENAEKHIKDALVINSLLPHHIQSVLDDLGNGARLVHISTDCVFSGSDGQYREQSVKDGLSVYAQTKSLGEVTKEPHLTIRTSIIGPELKEDGCGLFLWFMKQSGDIDGYDRVYWNGVTTLELAKAIKYCIAHDVSGLYHLCHDEKVSKFQLLTMIKVVFDKEDVAVRRDTLHFSDKSLVNTRGDIQYRVQGYPCMLQELRDWMEGK
ncbi:SDR family oxidoreductase [Bacillus salacetis]|uniref:dTDP-4-dehydrorhamnose reductase n=1 Tax=Bacillus salacetis TaxID=2315464 RepID=A0A3A1RAV9_9BACI|nr:SDR family oxidoreductase [Bacillus salacetis]RIW39044.1 SDR family oxidoreductase [Bacillus salacetis]